MGVPGSANLLLAGARGYRIERSLRFNAPDSAFLSRAFTSDGGSTWTISCWLKRSEADPRDFSFTLMHAGAYPSPYEHVKITSNQIIYYNDGGASAQGGRTTSAVFRDCSAWYHIVCVRQGTNQFKIYVNGVEQAAASNTNPSASYALNKAATMYIGQNNNYDQGGTKYSAGYLTEYHFVSGQALTPADFGETDTITGVWKPKKYAGTYGTNGFYLKFADNSGTTSTTLGKDSSGNGNNWTPNNLSAATGGPTSVNAASGGLPIYNTTDTYGTTKGTGTRTDSNSGSIVLAIAMDGTNNGTTFTDESATIKGSGTAKTITRNGNSKTSTVQSKFYGSSGYFDGTGDTLTVPAGTDFAYGTGDFSIEAWIYPESTADKVIFAQTISGTNYVQFGKSASGAIYFTGTSSGAGTPIITTTTVSQNTWSHVAVTRQSNTVRIFINGVLSASSTNSTDFSNTTYVPTIGAYTHASSHDWSGYINDFRVYKGVAKYTSSFNPPSNTQNTTVAAGNDSLIDTPTPYADGGNGRGNYCTWNPVAVSASASTFTNGNLDITTPSSNGGNVFGTFAIPNTGKWYWEVVSTAGSDAMIGISPYLASANYQAVTGAIFYFQDGRKFISGTGTAYGASYTTNDVIGVAVDADAGTITFYKNNSSQGAISGTVVGLFPSLCDGSGAAGNSYTANFGQRPFAYTPPSGFLALNTQNLPEPTIKKPSSYFDAVAYSGDNTNNRTIAMPGSFQPDLFWVKSRSGAYSHILVDSARGANWLSSNSTGAESTNSSLGWTNTGFTTNGIIIDKGSNVSLNNSGDTYVAWCWDEGATPGFDIVTYTGDGVSNRTVGHALGVAPAMIIIKDRDTNSNANNWFVWHQNLSSGNNIQLEKTDPAYAVSSTAGGGIGTSPSSSTFTLLNGSSSNVNTNENGDRFVAYLWSEVAGFSKFGSYTGNGSSDGPFIYCGFRPRWVLIKRTDSAENWWLHDTARSPYNTASTTLAPNLSVADQTLTGSAGYNIDFVSNGFKVPTTNVAWNASGGTYVFAAFSESAFKYSLAR